MTNIIHPQRVSRRRSIITLPAVFLLLLIPSLRPVSGQSALARGIELFEAGSYKEAVEWLERAVEEQPGDVTAHRRLFEAYNHYGQTVGPVKAISLARKMRQELEIIIELDPASVDERRALIQFHYFLPGLLGGDKEHALELVEELRRIDPREGTLAIVEIHTEDEDYADAIRECETFLRAVPGDTRIRQELGRVYHAQERWEDAFGLFEEIIAEDPRDPYTCYLVGRSAAVSGRNLERGVVCLRSFLEHRDEAEDPDDIPSAADAHWRLGMICEHQNDLAAARAEYETALRLDPDHREAKAALRDLREP